MHDDVVLTRRSLRTQILAWFLTGLALAALLAVLVLYEGGSRVFEGWLIRANQLLATSIRRQLEHGLSHDADAANRLGTELVVARGDPAKRAELADSFLLYNEIFSNAYVYDRAGKLVSFHYRQGTTSTTAHAGEDYHAYPGGFAAAADAALAAGHPAFTPVYFTPSGRAQLSYLVPLPGHDRQPEEILSLAVYAVDERVDGWIRGLAPGREGYVVVLDANGRVVAHTGEVPRSLTAHDAAAVRALTHTDAAPPGVDSAGTASSGTVVLDGREDLLIGGRLTTTGFWVWVGMPRAVAYAPLHELKVPAFAALLVVLVVGLLGAIHLSRTILRPVEELVGGIRRVGDGVLSHRVPEGRADELGEAAHAFNQMADRLQRDQLVEEVWREVHRP